MNCKKCGKKMSFLTDNSYNVVIDGKDAYVCEECYNKFYIKNSNTNNSKFEEKQKAENVDSIASKTIDKVMSNARTHKKAKGPTASAASTLKIISNIICAFFIIAGGAVGALVVGDDDFWILTIPIGAVAGFVIGFIITLFIRFLAELGINTKITAEATRNANKVSETDQVMMYKELLDNGAITQEEFDKKKKELLNL